MIIDNFEIIRNFLNFNSKDEFYVITLWKRGKDQNDGSNSSYVKVIRNFYVTSMEYFDSHKQTIIDLCEMENARAYINLNKKNYKQVAMKGLELMAHLVAHEEYHTFKTIFDTACGQTGSCDGDKRWIIDIDREEDVDFEELIKDIIDTIIRVEPFGVDKIIGEVPTVNGCHLITKPFNKKKFGDLTGMSDAIKDNNPTLLYFNKKN